jgi:hypothetical protein
VYQITEPGFNHQQPVTAPTIGGVVMVRVAAGCSRGSTVTLVPGGAFRTVRRVRAKDGELVAVVLKPLRSEQVFLTARRNGKTVGWLKLRIAKRNITH